MNKQWTNNEQDNHNILMIHDSLVGLKLKTFYSLSVEIATRAAPGPGTMERQ